MADTVAVRIAWDPKNLDNNGKVKRVSVEEARTLVRDGRAAYVNTDEKPKTVDAILEAVGDDPGKAQEALDAEQAQEKPRVTLVDKLTEIAAAGQVDPASAAAPFGGRKAEDDTAAQ